MNDDPKTCLACNGARSVLVPTFGPESERHDCPDCAATSAPDSAAPSSLSAEQANGLLEQYARAFAKADRLHAEYMGKAMSDEVYDTFATLRDDTLPALHKQLVAALTTPAQAPAIQAPAAVALPDFRDRKALLEYIKPAPFFAGLKAMFREYGSVDRDEPQEDIARDFRKSCDDMCATWEELRQLLLATPSAAVSAEPVATDHDKARHLFDLAERWADARVQGIRENEWGPWQQETKDALWEACRVLAAPAVQAPEAVALEGALRELLKVYQAMGNPRGQAEINAEAALATPAPAPTQTQQGTGGGKP